MQQSPDQGHPRADASQRHKPLTAQKSSSRTAPRAEDPAPDEPLIFLTEKSMVALRMTSGRTEVSRSEINLSNERALVDCVIRALCQTFDLKLKGFHHYIVISQSKHDPDRGTIGVAAKYLGARKDELAFALREFCDQEIVKHMDRVVAACQQIASEPRSLHAGAAVSASTSSTRGSDPSVAQSQVSEEQQGEVARSALAEQLVRRLGGRTVHAPFEVISGESRHVIDCAIPAPPTVVEVGARLSVTGYLDALSRSRPKLEFQGLDGEGKKGKRYVVDYKYDERTLKRLSALFRVDPAVVVTLHMDKTDRKSPDGRISSSFTLAHWEVAEPYQRYSEPERLTTDAPPRTEPTESPS